MKSSYKLYKQYNNIPLIEIGHNAYNVNDNTKLGQLIRQAQKDLSNCVVWYEVENLQTGTVNIIYKEI